MEPEVKLNVEFENVASHAVSIDFEPDSICGMLQIDRTSPEGLAGSLPFTAGDVTGGVENELQAVVIGSADRVDLPQTIRSSNYFRNIVKRARAGDTSARMVTALENFLDDNPEQVWENSWVRMPRAELSVYADQVLERDLLADKNQINGPKRSDAPRFSTRQNGEEFLKFPVSYLLKLSLAEVISSPDTHPMIRVIGERLLKHFLNDNTSPETFSFHPVPFDKQTRLGEAVAAETLKRYMLCQCLIMYANRKFRLCENGQKAVIFFMPRPSLRQQRLNTMVSDSFYRELFMNPCLSGWNRGEEKHRYMFLCHNVLSRSHLNTVAKLRECGIVTRNLIVLPNVSNISLANNGTHVSLGSLKLSRLLSDVTSPLNRHHEKYMGDLAVKIIEHFLPLFVGTYSADPYRMGFGDFHPEKALGFLPHEMDFTHLRMIWRLWKSKACLRVLGRSLTPFGPELVDRAISRLFRLKGDQVNDFRLINYLSALMSTDQSPALDGTMGNELRLKQDLADMGVFDGSMSLYMLCKLRKFEEMGFSGFESRYYSLFESLRHDMAHAVNLQTLITALAFKYIVTGQIRHENIPDDPSVESERRQVFFASSIGIRQCYIRQKSPNRLMAEIIRKVKHVRPTRRYPGYLKIDISEFNKALIGLIQTDGADLVELMGMADTIDDLSRRIEDSGEHTANGRLTRGILGMIGGTDPMKTPAPVFNAAAEKYYREKLQIQHMKEAFKILENDFAEMDSWQTWRDGYYNPALLKLLKGQSAVDYLERIKKGVLKDSIDESQLSILTQLMLLTIDRDMARSKQYMEAGDTAE